MSSAKLPNIRNQVVGRQTRISVEQALPDTPMISLSALTGSESVTIEFKDVDYVNSSGLRTFTKWLKELEGLYPDMVVRFEGVPSVIARHLLILKDYLPKKLEIGSLYVPYYCENCDREDHTTLVKAQLLRSKEKYTDALPEKVICAECGTKMEADIVPNRYLSLLDDRSKW